MKRKSAIRLLFDIAGIVTGISIIPINFVFLVPSLPVQAFCMIIGRLVVATEE